MRKICLGVSGILHNVNDARAVIYVPSYDICKAMELMRVFLEIRINGQPLEHYYYSENINYLAGITSKIYWDVIYQYVNYYDFFVSNNPRDVVVENEKLHFLHGMLHGATFPIVTSRQIRNNAIHRKSTLYRNRKALRANATKKIILMEGIAGNFRLSAIKKALLANGSDFLPIHPVMPFKNTLQQCLPWAATDSLQMFPPLHPVPVIPANTVFPDLSQKDLDILKIALLVAVSSIHNLKQQVSFYSQMFSGFTDRILFGLDEMNEEYMSIILGAREAGIRTVGFQHGLYCSTHAAYTLPGHKMHLAWYDKVLVWGDYWKQFMEKASPCHAQGRFVVGTNKHRYCPTSKSSVGPVEGRKHVLIPHEFLNHTALTGQFICRLQALGYTVFFKPRSDEPLQGQLACLLLPLEAEEKLVILDTIDDESMAQIDIVAGAQTTLVYDLLPYRKLVWIFDGPFHMLRELVDLGIARLIRLETLEADIAGTCPGAPTEEQITMFDSQRSLEVVLRDEFCD